MATLIERYTGTLLALATSLGFTLMDATAQSCMRHGLGPAQVVFGRMIITVPCIGTYLYLRHPAKVRQLDPRSRRHDVLDLDGVIPAQREAGTTARLIWTRAILISIGLYFAFASMQRIEISEFISVYSPRAFLVGFLCWAVLKEDFGWRLRVAAFLSTIAVILVVEPPFLFGSVSGDSGSRMVGFLFCFAYLVEDALEMVVLRAIGPGVDPLIMTLAYGLCCLPVNLGLMYLPGETIGRISDLNPLVYLELPLLAALGIIAQVCCVMAMQRESGATVSVVLYSQIPMSAVVQSVLIGQRPNMLQVVGMVIIAVAGVWTITAENNEREGSKDKTADAEGYTLLPMAERGEHPEDSDGAK